MAFRIRLLQLTLQKRPFIKVGSAPLVNSIGHRAMAGKQMVLASKLLFPNGSIAPVNGSLVKV
jgi:hypothetical protein